MSQKFRTPIDSSLITSKVHQLQERLRKAFVEGTTENQVLAEAFRELQDFFDNLGAKTMMPLLLTPDGVRDPAAYNKAMKRIEDDLSSIIDDSKHIANGLVATTNYSLTNQRNLLAKLERITSSNVDLQLANDDIERNIFIAGDDFVDDSKVDANFSVPGTRTVPRPFQNAVTLSPTQAVNVLLDGNAKVTRIEGPPRTGSSSGLYEGKFYNWLGEAVPEGGVGFRWIKFIAVPAASEAGFKKHQALLQKWNSFIAEQFGVEGGSSAEVPVTETTVKPLPKGGNPFDPAHFAPRETVRTVTGGRAGSFTASPVDLRRLLLELRDDPAYQSGAQTYGTGYGFTLSELELILGNYQDEIGSDYYVLPYESLSESEIPNESKVLYRPAVIPLSLMILWRTRGTDGNPATVLRFENNVDVTPGFGLANKWPPDDWTAFEKVLRSLIGTEQLTDQLQKYAGGDEANMMVRLTIELERPIPVNWLHLIPLVEAPGAWLRVEDIEFALEDANDNYQTLPGLHSNKYDNVLTDEANREISEDEALVTLSPDRGQYTGSGLWIFPTREAKFIRITLRQDVLTAAPYEVVVLHIQNTVTINKTTQKTGFLGGIFGGSSTRHQTETRVLDQIVPLSYEQSLIFSHTESDELRDSVSSQTQGAQSEAERVTANYIGFNTGIPVGTLVGDILGGIFGTTTVTTQISQTGWKIQESWQEARFDKARYAIGIRDIGLFGYSYTEASSFVSKRFLVPRPIEKVALFTDEFIPEEFRTSDPSVSWILYEVSFDDSNWFPISPLAQDVSTNQEGRPVAQILNVNSSLPQQFRNGREAYLDFDQQVSQIRIRVSFRRPTDMETFSPVLKRYRLKLVLKGGLF